MRSTRIQHRVNCRYPSQTRQYDGRAITGRVCETGAAASLPLSPLPNSATISFPGCVRTSAAGRSVPAERTYWDAGLGAGLVFAPVVLDWILPAGTAGTGGRDPAVGVLGTLILIGTRSLSVSFPDLMVKVRASY